MTDLGQLEPQIQQTLCPGMVLPEPLRLLFHWIEQQGFASDTSLGTRVGLLQCGTAIEFFAEGNVDLMHGFGHDSPEVRGRLCVFAKTGAEGSTAAFWLDPAGGQKIVHLGSGSGSTLVCILAEDPVDFLRLLAIGYDEICWDSDFSEPPAFAPPGAPGLVPNTRFQEWVRHTFSVDLPGRGLDIVRHPAQMHDEHSPDPFWQWMRVHLGW